MLNKIQNLKRHCLFSGCKKTNKKKLKEIYAAASSQKTGSGHPQGCLLTDDGSMSCHAGFHGGVCVLNEVHFSFKRGVTLSETKINYGNISKICNWM